MRIIAGTYRSRRLKTLPGFDVRPTPDRLRETLFNVLAPEIEGTVFLDAYAGTGAVGIEALSRGARHVILFERSPAAVALIHENLNALEIGAGATVCRGNALTLIPKHTADIAFIDPPYSRHREYQAALELLSAAPCNLVIAQHDHHLKLPETAGPLHVTRVIRQGSNALTFYRPRDTQVIEE
jgi:16S rRNA (guanine(966)-N(2))-methyltransferase RsmD